MLANLTIEKYWSNQHPRTIVSFWNFQSDFVDQDQDDIDNSRATEIKLYTSIMKNLYDAAFLENSSLFDACFEGTKGFSDICVHALLSNPRIIKILRYSVIPPVSQMKFGQIFGTRSIGKFEGLISSDNSTLHDELKIIATEICKFVKANLDRDRFPWVIDKEQPSDIQRHYAKAWTCSIMSVQNAETEFRKFRKNKQEEIPLRILENSGYSRRLTKGTITKLSDLAPGEYDAETKVAGRTNQKADVVIRSKQSKELILLEAKAVGVEIDATKRVKEWCDKSNDWSNSKNRSLGSPIVIAMIAGFFTKSNLNSLRSSNIEVIWEHKANELVNYL